MCRTEIFRALAGFMCIAFVFASPSMSIDFSQEPSRLGSGWVSAIALSPDGTILAAWYNPDRSTVEGELHLWDVRTQQQVSTFNFDEIISIAFSPDGTLLALGSTGAAGNKIHLWDVAGQNQVGLMQSPTQWGVRSVAFSPDGETLASSGDGGDRTVCLWDVQTQQQVGALRGHTGQGIRCVAFSPDGRLLFSGGHRGDETIRVWDVQTQQQVGELIGHLDVTYDLAFSPDRATLASASGSNDRLVYLWDFDALNQVGVLGPHSAHVGSIAFSPDGKLLASTVLWDNTVHIWDVASQEELGVLKGHDATDFGWCDNIDISSDGRWLACGSENGVELWEINLPGPVPLAYAYGPEPYNGTLHDDTWVTLGWQAGDFAVSHDVYFSDNFEDVNVGAESTFQGNQIEDFFVVGFPGFAYPDGLVPGVTYYWRIDEINDLHPDSPWRGSVWSFMITPRKAYDPVPADSAEFVDLDVELRWTAGLNAALHTVYFGDKFDDVNNATGGPKQVTRTYTPGLLEFAKTYYWRVDELGSARGGQMHKGDVWSFVTVGAAGNPDPSNAATSVEMNAILSWKPADHAASHQVYFGTDKEAVRNANIGSSEYKGTQTLGAESFDPGILLWDTTYYWRVDEVNNLHPESPWPGSVWSFTTGDFLLIDDFEDYSLDNQIWWSWKDGAGYANHPTEPPYAGNGTGSRIGDESTGSTANEDTAHKSRQSMPYRYDNNKMGFLKYSEATMTLTSPRDWTENGVRTLSIWAGADGNWVRGTTSNDDEPMYVVLNGSAVVYHDNPGATGICKWMEWRIDLEEFADLGIDLTNVHTIGIGFGDRNNPQPGGKGLMFFDDIRLCR